MQVLRCSLKNKTMTKIQQLIHDQITSINYGGIIQNTSRTNYSIDANSVGRNDKKEIQITQ